MKINIYTLFLNILIKTIFNKKLKKMTKMPFKFKIPRLQTKLQIYISIESIVLNGTKK